MATISTITATTAVIGEGMTINIQKASPRYTHTIEYAFGDTNGTIATKTAKTQLYWTVPADLVYQIPNDTTGTIVLYCYTYEGDREVGYNYILVDITVPESAKLSVSLDCVEADSKVAALGNGAYRNYFLKHTSDVSYTINAESPSGAEIVSYSITNGGVTYTSATGVFKNVSDPYFYVICTDSRGMVTNERFYHTLYDYIRLTCNLAIKEVDPEDGIITMSISGNFFNKNFYNASVALKNTMTLRVDCVDKQGNTITKTVTPTFSGNTYTAEVSFEDIDYRAVYDVTGYASDKLMDVQSKTVSVAGKPIFDWSNEDFRFHIPITKIGEYPFADYVIETGETSMGSNGTWYWRKWASGRAECVGTRNYGIYLIHTSIYGMSRGSLLNQSFPQDLFIEEPDYINMRMKHSKSSTSEGEWGGASVVYCGTKQARDETVIYPSAENTGTFTIIVPGIPASEDIRFPATHICIEAVGRWK